MGRKRRDNKQLPQRVYLKHGAYYFVDVSKKWHRLGSTTHEMYSALANLQLTMESSSSIMNDLFSRYMLEIAPFKSKASFTNNVKAMKNLRVVFGELEAGSIKPIHLYRYLDIRGKDAKIAANREISLLSHVFTMAIKWGVIETNPCRGIKKHPEGKRDRYVTDEELIAVRSLASPMMQGIIDFAYQTGLRKADILGIKLSDMTDEGICLVTKKNKKKIRICWNPDLKDLVDRMKKIRFCHSFYLFHNKKGAPYTASGFDTLWQRLRNKCLAQGVLKETFCFHDFRRKAATEADRVYGREHARQLLAHSSQEMTDRYISGEVDIKPLKKLSNI